MPRSDKCNKGMTESSNGDEGRVARCMSTGRCGSKCDPSLMCWRVSLPVDTTAEAGPTPPQQHGGMHRPSREIWFDKSGESGSGKGKDPGTMLQRFEPVGAAYWPLQPPLCPRRYSLAPVFVRCLGRPALLCVQGFGTSVQTHIDCGKLGPPECSTVRASYSAGREPEDLGALVVAAAATAAGSRSAPHSLLSFGTSRRRE